MLVRGLRRLFRAPSEALERLEKIQLALGRIESRQTRTAASFIEAEFQVFSQWGEDGIIQYLLQRVSRGRLCPC